MINKDDGIYIEHMLDCAMRIVEYTNGEREIFFNSTLVQDAVLRNLQTLAESSQRLSDTVKKTYPAIPWREIAGFRNILVHDYLGIDLSVIWSVVEQDLPHLLIELRKIHANYYK